MIKPEYRYSELTGKIIGCAMEVHNALGNGFQEVIYQRALEYEMELQKIAFAREVEMPVFYKQKDIGSRRVDFLVDEKICVELKALTQLEDVHLAQAINYLEAFNLEVGLLINFGNTKLEFKESKIKNSRHHDHHKNHNHQGSDSMKTIDVCLSPELMHLYDLNDRTVVVVDILRATSCMVTAFAHGVESITPVANLEECLKLKTKGYVTSGERDGKKVEGFDKGNSPFEYIGEEIRGLKLAFTTTNGTQAIEKAKGAREVIIGSFLNLTSVVRYLLLGENNVLIVCAGWKGRVNLEDTLFAGAVVEKLKDYLGPDCDAPLAAQHLYNIAKDDMVKFLGASSHVKRLNRLNIHKDIEFCVTPDLYKVLPKLRNGVLLA